MRVCLVSEELTPFWGAGIGTYAACMARAWAEAGHETHVVTGPHEGLRERGGELLPGVHLHAADQHAGQAALGGYTAPAMKQAMAVYERLLAVEGQFGEFDYIEFADFAAEGHFALRAKRTIGQFGRAVTALRLHTPSADCYEINGSAWLTHGEILVSAMEGQCIRDADLLVSPTRSLLERVRARWPAWAGESVKPGVVVPYPFDVDSVGGLLDGATEAATGVPERPYVLYFGRMERRKGPHLLVEAGQRLLDGGLDLDFRFVGGDTYTGPVDTSMRARLQRMASWRHPERFIFEDRVPRSELAALIRNARCVCLPSVWENFPNACLEAMALGAPVVGSNAGGMAEQIVDGESGVLFHSGDVESLTLALRRVLTDDGLRERIAAGAPERIRALCDPATVTAQTEAAIASRRAALTRAESAPARLHEAPEVSVVIPHFNLGEHLMETIESVRAQTARDRLEIIVVDDGSTDEASLELIAKLKSEAADLRVIEKPNGGLSSARNAGVAEARGRWVVPLDADDLIAPTFVERCLAAAERAGGADLAMVTSLVASFFDEGPASAEWIWVPLGLDRELLPVTNVASCCVALIRKDLIDEVGGYDEWLSSYEDWDLYCGLAEHGYRAEVIPERLIFYRQREGSMRRAIGLPNIHRFRAHLCAKHPELSRDPALTQRFLAMDVMSFERDTAAQMQSAASLGPKPTRHVIADRLNDAMKRTPLHGVLKAAVSRASKQRD